ncbi:MAG TPA: hypothetical protein PKL13_04390 [bacterium]|nr:hypothetical protein [bacterium]
MKDVGNLILIVGSILIISFFIDLIILKIKFKSYKKYKRNSKGAISRIEKTSYSEQYFYISYLDKKTNKWHYALEATTDLERIPKYTIGRYWICELRSYDIDSAIRIADNYTYEEFYNKFNNSIFKEVESNNQKRHKLDKEAKIEINNKLKNFKR